MKLVYFRFYSPLPVPIPQIYLPSSECQRTNVSCLEKRGRTFVMTVCSSGLSQSFSPVSSRGLIFRQVSWLTALGSSPHHAKRALFSSEVTAEGREKQTAWMSLSCSLGCSDCGPGPGAGQLPGFPLVASLLG